MNKNILKYKIPKELFGDIKTKEELHGKYKQIAKENHPDAQIDIDKPIATQIFSKIVELYDLAKIQIDDGSYNAPKAVSMTISLPKFGEIKVYDAVYSTEYHTYFEARLNNKSHILKVVNHEGDNDLIQNESETIKHLAKEHIDTKKVNLLYPKIVKTFKIKNKAAALIAECNFNDFVTVEDIIKENPDGIDEKDMAWMFRRMLVVASISYLASGINGSLVPSNVFLNLQDHSIFIPDWSFSVGKWSNKKYISGFYGDYKDFYPKEVFDKTPSASLDIFMAAKVANKLCNAKTDKRISNFLNWCMAGPNSRPDTPMLADNKFVELIESLFGKRVFRDFSVKNSSIRRY